MKRKNMTRNALVTSILALLLCVSMLVGTTFAWFTDSVESLNNVITAGNLDIEVTNENGDISGQEKLFQDVDLWEPGVVAYENLNIANVGTLALKYEMSLVFGEQNTVTDNGLGLADVLKIAVIDEKVTADNRDALIAGITDWILLSDLNETGKLYPEGKGTSEEDFAIVIWWEPSDEDNKWNVNNGRTTSDGEPLHIALGLNVFATQLPYEEDSFDNTYDEMIPEAGLTKGEAPESIEWGSYGQWSPTYPNDQTLDCIYTFVAPHTAETVTNSKYKDWYCDFVVSLDRDVTITDGVGDLFLGGNYGSFGWIGFENPVVVAANEEVYLLGSVTTNPWTYEMICANVGTFICGPAETYGHEGNLNGATLTVVLRLTNPATGEELDVATVKHTFSQSVATAAELQTALNNGLTEIKLGDNIDMGSDKLTVASDVVLDLNGYVLSGTCDTGSGALIAVNNGAALDIKDNSSTKSGKITYAQGTSNVGWAIYVEGELNLYSGTIELTGDSWSIGYCVDVRPNAWGTNYTEETVFHMYGGKLVSSDGAIRVASSSSDSYTNIVASFIMDGGEIDAAWDGIFVQQSNAAYDTLNVTINNGSVTSKLSPIRVYAPAATSVNAGTEKPMTITVNGGDLLMNGTPDETRVWHTMGKIVIGGGITLDQLNQYAAITIA